jgi:23S rRNA (adenine2503-C2)-methyltransferase
MRHLQTINSSKNYPNKKYVFEEDGKTVEASYINREDKDIICLSSMYGCSVGCGFCASGKSYNGDLHYEDILNTAIYIFKDNSLKENDKRKLFSFMGSGEPLLNVQPVKESIKSLSKWVKNSYFSLATSGIATYNLAFFVDDIHILEVQPKIMFSLHSPFDSQRKILIPKTQKLEYVLDMLQSYKMIVDKQIELNYVILQNFNDSKDHAKELVNLVRQTGFDLKINKYHDVSLGFKESRNKDQFIEWLKEKGVNPEIYVTDGEDIQGSCGQLTSKHL